MGKGLQIVLLAVLFAASGVAGYFVEGFVIKGDKSESGSARQDKQSELIEKSSLPEYQYISEVTKDSRGLYEFNAEYSAETGDSLTYTLYSDAECLNLVASNEDGRFISVPGTESGTYYLKVTNVFTGEASEVEPVDGFKKVNLVKRLSSEELYSLMMKGFQNAPQYTNQRISDTNHKLIVTNLRDDNDPGNIRNVYMKLKNRTWKDVKIVSIDYDSENKLTTLKIEAVY